MTDIDDDLIAAQRRPSYLRFLSLGISGVLIVGGAFVMYRWISGPEILSTFRRIDWRWLIPAIFAYWLQNPITALRMNCVMHWLMQPGSPAPPSFRLILKVTLSSAFIAVTAPIGLMADVAKIGALKYFGQMSTSHAIRCTFFDRVIAVQWMALFALATLPLQWALDVPRGSIGIQFLVCASVVVAIVVLLILPNLLGIFDHKIVLKLARLFSGYKIMFPLRRSAVQMVISAANLTLAFATLYCLLRSIGFTTNLTVIACFVPFLQIVNGVPFLYMGWGGREIAMAATVGVATGLSINQALALSAIWGVTLILAGAINGVFVFGDWHSHRSPATPPTGMPPVG